MRADIHDGLEQMLQSKAGYIDARPLTASSAKPLATHGRTIHPGQTRRFCDAGDESGLPPRADVRGSRLPAFEKPQLSSVRMTSVGLAAFEHRRERLRGMIARADRR